MAFAFSTSIREVLEQVVRTPRYQELARIPLIPTAEIALVAGVFIGLYLSTFAYLEGWLPWPLVIAINGVLIYASFTPLHDATHRTVSSNRIINDALGTLSCLVLLPGITAAIYRYLHLEHHRFAGDPSKDPDEIFVSSRPAVALFPLAFPDVVWSIWYVKHWRTRAPSERLEFCLCIAFYVAVHIVFLSSPYAFAFFVCWMIPQRIGLALVTYFFARIQHPEDVTWEAAPFQTTVKVRCGLISKVLLLGQARHCVHHLLPSIPYYRYHRAWEAGRYLFEQQNIPERGLFRSAGPVEIAASDTAAHLQVQVRSVSAVADDVNTYVLAAPPGGEPLPAVTAGAHVDVLLGDGLVRQYSLCGDPAESGRYQIAVRREDQGRGGSIKVHETLQEGSALTISAPRNNFPLNPEGREYVLVAGGIGVTPLLSMAYTLKRDDRPFVFHICASGEDRLPFGQRLQQFPFAGEIKVHLGIRREPESFWANAVLGNYRKGRTLYVCGPDPFMNTVVNAAHALGWPNSAIYSENFKPRERGAVENVAFEVQLSRSGQVLHVGEDEYLLDVLNRAKAGIPCSCTQGICGSCITPVVSGDIDHRDAVLSDDERASGKKMCVCVSRARSGRLVLDI
ncbi:MAG: fatty acid desaturase [Pseudomonadota bacterium]